MLDEAIHFLSDMIGNPPVYLAVLFVYSVLAAVILPIPVELGLSGFIQYLVAGESFMGLGIFPAFLLLALVMGLGKAAGSWIVFQIGIRVEDDIRRWFRWNWFQKLTDLMARFSEKYGYIAMYLILSVPIMPDTVPLYIFSLLNKDGQVFEIRWFVLSNLWAGMSRALIVGIAAMLVVYGAA